MNDYKLLLREQFSAQIKASRNVRKLTQEEMAEKLHSDLERGRSCCSAIALLFFLLMLETDELKGFLAQMRKQFRIQEQKEAA